MKTNYLAMDQYGQKWFLHTHPRKELLAIFGRAKASKMYCDRKDGAYHTGYIIGQHWITVVGLEGVVFAKKD